MNSLAKLRKYAELLKKNLSGFLAHGISIDTTIYPVNQDGAVFEFIFNNENKKLVNVAPPSETVSDVLAKVPQKLIAGNLSNVTFSGTNIYMEDNRLLLIKGDEEAKEWDGNAAKKDAMRVISTSQGGSNES